MALYLIHFEPEYPGGRRPSHYLGWTTNGNVENRVLAHLNGQGSPLIKAAVEIGCEFRVARVWPKGTRTLESQIKKQKNGYKHLCPVCKEGGLYGKGHT